MFLKLIIFKFWIIINLLSSPSLVSTHWMCSGVLDCPASAKVYQREDLLFEKGNCFVDSLSLAGVSRIICSSYCITNKCAIMISDGDSCVISGIQIGSPANQNRFIIYPVSVPPASHNVARNKPITCSSNVLLEDNFDTRCITANDGIDTEEQHFFHSDIEVDLKPWVVIDLEKHYAIYKLELLPRTNSPTGHVRARDITFYIGSVEVTDGKFQENGYKVIYFYAGPYGDPVVGGNTYIEKTLDSPVCGRYLVAAKDGDTIYDPSTSSHILEITEIKAYSTMP